MRLSSFFSESEISKDAEVLVTLPPTADQSGIVCYILDESALQIANANDQVTAVIVTPDLKPLVGPNKGCVVATNPKEAFYRLHSHLVEAGMLRPHDRHDIHPSAQIHPSAVVGKNVMISKGVTVGAHATIEDNSIIGEDTWIGPNVVVGGRGLQDTYVDGKNMHVAFAGGVRIGARCEILSAALIQRPYLCHYTEIGDDTKLGPGANVGHGCRIGKMVMVGVRSVVAGNCTVSDKVWIGASAVISDGLHVGSGARVLLGSVVIRDVKPGESVSGNFALSHTQNLRVHTRLRHER